MALLRLRPRSLRSALRPALVAGIAALTLGSAALVGLAPAHADDDTNGSSIGTLTADPATGPWDGSNGTVTLSGNFTCPSDSLKPDGLGYLYLAEKGHEAPAIGVDGELAVTTTKYPFNSAGIGPVTGEDGTLISDPSVVFPPIAGGISYWNDPNALGTHSPQEFLDQLDTKKKYSLVVACARILGAKPPGGIRLMPDSTGHVIAAWSALTLSADKTQWTVTAPKADTTVQLSVTPTVGQATLSAAVQVDGTTAPAASGDIRFDRDGVTLGTVPLQDGIATTTATSLTVGQRYGFTATYVPAANAAFSPSTSSTVAATIPAADVSGTELEDGATLTPKTAYKVTAPAGTFTAGDKVTGEIHSEPIALTATSVVIADGSTVYAFTAPADVPAGDHELILTDAHARTFTVPFTVAAVGVGTTTDDPSDPAAIGGNTPVSFATDWVGGMASTPAGMAGLFGLLVLTGGVLVGGWLVFWRRRGRASAPGTNR